MSYKILSYTKYTEDKWYKVENATNKNIKDNEQGSGS